jgi:hypothetical protein
VWAAITRPARNSQLNRSNLFRDELARAARAVFMQKFAVSVSFGAHLHPPTIYFINRRNRGIRNYAMQHFLCPFEIRSDNSNDGTITGYGSTFGNIDSYGDTVAPGAFKTLAASDHSLGASITTSERPGLLGASYLRAEKMSLVGQKLP